MHSQNDEEKYILENFKNKKNGTFLDIGAYDGIKISNTYQLYLNGWHGTYLEPSAKIFRRLSKNIKNRCNLVNCALGDKNDIIEFWECREDTKKYGISTLSKNYTKEKGESLFDFYYSKSITWDVLIKKFGSEYDFISIDVESLNSLVINLFPIELFKKLSLICIEKEKNIEFKNLYKNNFEIYHETKDNLIFKRTFNIKII